MGISPFFLFSSYQLCIILYLSYFKRIVVLLRARQGSRHSFDSSPSQRPPLRSSRFQNLRFLPISLKPPLLAQQLAMAGLMKPQLEAANRDFQAQLDALRANPPRGRSQSALTLRRLPS
jgi:hypothetical protein